jgi:hypothetical protein
MTTPQRPAPAIRRRHWGGAQDTGDTRKLEHQIAQDLLAMEKKASSCAVCHIEPSSGGKHETCVEDV